ncbi:MAG: PaaI family thioesterase [Candidatus Eremiobacteraeota bacterium]|nr:PaaI family thioesterase [Candidatus Eremiobacteraeota bacterium]
MNRERTYSWGDPAELIAAMGGEESHLAWMQGMIEGRLPAPAFGATLELRPIEASLDRLTFAMPLREWMLNPAGGIHGGALAALLDSVMTLAVIARLDRSKIATTTTLTTHFVRPLLADGSEVRAVAEVLHCGRTHATARALLTDAQGRLAAHGDAAFAIVPAPFAAP